MEPDMTTSTSRACTPRLTPLAANLLACGLLLAACGGGGDSPAPPEQALGQGGVSAAHTHRPPVLGARSKAVLKYRGQSFKDLNGNGQVDPYENWRLSADERADDLVSRMTLEEKSGMLLIDTLNPGFGGVVAAPALDYIDNQKMKRFIFRSVVTATPVQSANPGLGGQPVTPEQAATWTNQIQELQEATRLGIPALFKSNARNHYERAARFGINTESGSFSEWPKEPGLAATRDMRLIKDFAQTMGDEWKAIGLRGMYGYMADTATEPRWYRVHETFSEDFDLNADIVKTLVRHLQGGPVNPGTAVALTLKHFPGGGPQELGLDPHYSFGKNQVYPAGRFGDHLKPFMAAIDAGVSSIMPYYGVPISVTYRGVTYEQTGMAFSKQIVTDLLRDQLGFEGYVNSDTGIINDRAWGLEDKTVPQRVAAAVNGGTDVLSGFHDKQTIIDLVTAGLLTEARINEAVKRQLIVQFRLGLFENPYVDASAAAAIIGKPEFRAKALEAQRKSITLLQNQNQAAGGKTLPLPAPTAAAPVKLYTMGLNAAVVGAADYGGYTVEAGDYGTVTTPATRPSAAGADYAIIRVEVSNPRAAVAAYRSLGATTGANPAFINPLTGLTWGQQDPCVTHPATNPNCVDDNAAIGGGLIFGGALPWEANNLSFTTMAASASWQISPKLSDIQAVMNEVGANKVVLNIYFRQPYVMDEASGLKNAGAILAGFGVSDSALMDVITGKFKPRGKLPFALANNLQAVIDNDPDAPGYAPADTLYPFGFGLTYCGEHRFSHRAHCTH
jgi:beta-glucosidase